MEQAFLIVLYLTAAPMPVQERPFYVVDSVEECDADAKGLITQVRDEMMKAGTEIGSVWYSCLPVKGRDFTGK